MPWVEPGAGNRYYPVLELVLNGERVGIEIVFLGWEDELRQIYASWFEAVFPAFAHFVASGQADPLGDLACPMSQDEIIKEEARLGVPLPNSFKQFLSIAHSIDINGGGVCVGSVHPFWYDFGPLENLPQHKREAALSDGNGRWPPQSQGMLCFADFFLEGDGDQVLFDVKGGMVDGEYPVWYWNHERPAAYEIATGFRDWLERVVAMEPPPK